MKWNASKIEQKIGLQFKKAEILRLALIHPSYAQQINEPDDDNERLALLGQKILELATVNYLYHHCPYLTVSKWKPLQDKLLDAERLTKIWFNLGLGDAYPFLGLTEDRYTLRKRRNNPFPDGLRALVGAIYLDRGFSQGQTWIDKNLINPLLERHLKSDQERVTPAKQLQFLGDTLLPSLIIDLLYRLLPYVPPKLLNQLARQLQSKSQQKEYFQLLTDSDWLLTIPEQKSAIKTSFSRLLASVYLNFSQEADKYTLRQTRDWFTEQLIDTEEILKDAIALLLKDGKPQKWIIRNVMGYESKKYAEGRERFHELIDEEE